MPNRQINHQALHLNWEQHASKINPKTIVFGTFNPYNKNKIESHLDYFYGRNTNHFWKSLGRLLFNDEMYFFDNELGWNRKLEAMVKYSFVCIDFIDSIIIKGNDELDLNNFVENNIFNGFADNTLFATTTMGFEISRVFNERILDIIKNSNSLTKAIHTMGVGLYNKPVISGFPNYLRTVQNCLAENNIVFQEDSISPSQRTVNIVGVETFDQWLGTSLGII